MKIFFAGEKSSRAARQGRTVRSCYGHYSVQPLFNSAGKAAILVLLHDP